MKSKEMNTLCLSLIAIALSVAAFLPLYCENFETSTGSPLLRFSSFDELKGFVKSGQQNFPYYEKFMPSGSPAQFLALSGANEKASARSFPDFSETNIQVEGVDEIDFVKTDGEYIYVVSGRDVVIVKAYPPEEVGVLSKIKLNGTVAGLFINGNKLVAVEDEVNDYELFGSSPSFPRTFIRVYDVSERTNPVSGRNVSLDGNYFDSRMIGDYIYVVINRGVYDYAEKEVTLPKIYLDDITVEIPATDIYYSNVSDSSYTYTTIVAVNVQDISQEPTRRAFMLGWMHNMYVSLNNIYLTFPDWTQIADGVEKTSIHRIHVENDAIEDVASGSVPGYLLNQFSMDEYNGYFRVATTSRVTRMFGGAASLNNVYILDMGLNIEGKLEDLAAGETIYSARFMNGRCYLVTFKKVDPLFVIDLENPYNPNVLGYLKITGYSDYLHPYDESHLIGIGKETVEAEEGDFAWYQGVKISLFDVTDVENPKEVNKYEIGDRGTDSLVLSDHKALLFDKPKNLLVIPVRVAEINPAKYPGEIPPYAYGDYVWQGAYVFHVSLSQGLVLQGRITHVDNSSYMLKSGYPFSSSYFVKRALFIGNVLYTVSDKVIKMNSLENLEEINKVELP